MISENLNIIREKITSAEKKSGRDCGSVKLMAVSKFNPYESVIEAINNSQFLFGENRVQEAEQKFTMIKNEYNNVQLHMIGNLQSNKVKNIVKIADCIQSVDRVDLLKEIEKQCCKIQKSIKVLFEYHTAEDSKSGFKDEVTLNEALESCALNNFPHITPAGFMTMAPFTEDESKIRNSFITLRNLAQKYQKNYPMFNLTELSMGMSNDYLIAIEEGSTLVRIGTAIFGERKYQ